jgi:uncharacterized RDD family membrane protein YckC
MFMSEDNRYAPPRAKVEDTGEAETELASRGARFAGAFIDGLLVAILVWPYLLTTDYWARATSGEAGVTDLLGLSLVSMILFLVLHGYLLHKHGQTIGKRLVGTRIVSVADNQIISLGKVFGLRYVPIQLASVLPFLGSFLPLIDVVFIFREDRRCLHDLIAGTKVIKVK